MPVPAQEMQGIHGFEELLRHAMEKHPPGQEATDVAGGMYEWDGDMDGEYTAPAAKRTEDGDDGENTALAVKHTEDGDDGEYAAPAAARKRVAARARTAKHNVAYEKEPSPFVIYDTDSDMCEDVIICASTVDEQQLRYLGENHTGPGTILDSGFLGHVDPALLAP
ncbi:hypothetical protein C7999DRAFT_12829 [Corynascus novoguineensis]|uniref:Uncharacterized protein n=1 Tax=Corynascus novoguineensis TaxID=1126955 RepID=A0AAN7CWQ3_9PEZI|nr:hypothetical protein C7999DRAFT_12829 [Corynascus novoguineensis]